MRILVANDDGYLAPGLAALVEVCRGFAEVDVVAPEQNASGTSNALTLQRPLSVHTAANGFRYVNGTPSDCVHVALTGLLPQRPDLVVSGINNGANMGDDTSDELMFGAVHQHFTSPTSSSFLRSSAGSTLSAASLTGSDSLSPSKRRIFTATVGRKPTKAAYYLRDVEAVQQILMDIVDANVA